ncbi:MAG: C10 family peptidase [Bacteroidales bacterium]|nr:C10 family peptidase [Bacteroidales bacterium]
MKKIVLSILLFSISLCAFADVVSQNTAYAVASQFMNATNLTQVWDGSEVETKAAEDPLFYVYDVEGGGWVIVSGDDSATPILAYSESGSFKANGMPSNLGSWLGIVRKEIRKARNEGKKGNSTVQWRWQHAGHPNTKAGSSQKLLTTANWDQGSPYNSYLSTYVKNRNTGVSGLYTGCVATAMAEVLRYHKWPVKGTGTLEGYTTESKGYTVSSIDISKHTYDWDNMLSSYGSSATTAQKNAVALLMLDCGVMVKMDYTTTGSGAMSEEIVPALAEHMQYSKAARLKYRMDYSAEEWMDMIVYDIDNCGPILYSGQDPSEGGHQFVCQGYDIENTMIYINWGWSGDDNGWFAFDLNIQGSYMFSDYQSAVFGLVPDRDGSTHYPEDESSERIELNTYSSQGETYTGITLENGTVAKGETFTLGGGVFFNMGSGAYSGGLKVVLVDKDGTWKEDVSEEDLFGDDSVEQYYGFTEEIECTITKDIELGDRLAFWFLLDNGNWIPVKFNREDYSGTFEWACIDATFIKTKENYAAGDKFFFALIPGNKPISSVSWSFDGAATSADSVALTSGIHTISAQVNYTEGSSETITQEIVVK